MLVVPREEGEYSVGVAREGLPPGVELLQGDCLEVPREVRCCRPPVWYLPAQRTCVAGLCSVVRSLLRWAYLHCTLYAAQSPPGWQRPRRVWSSAPDYWASSRDVFLRRLR